MSISGDQDLKFKAYDSHGELTHVYVTDNIHESISVLNNVKISAWGDRDVWQYLGVRFEASSWSLTTEVKDPAYKKSLPFTSVTQERSSLLLNVLGRLPVSGFGSGSLIHRQTYLFGGVGGGSVYTNVQHGQQEWRYGCQLLGGLSVPLSPSSRFRIEGRYVLARDADITEPQPGWQVETSGTPTSFRLGRHWDTRFVGVMFGIDWRFR
jgi:hypothetical protein